MNSSSLSQKQTSAWHKSHTRALRPSPMTPILTPPHPTLRHPAQSQQVSWHGYGLTQHWIRLFALFDRPSVWAGLVWSGVSVCLSVCLGAPVCINALITLSKHWLTKQRKTGGRAKVSFGEPQGTIIRCQFCQSMWFSGVLRPVHCAVPILTYWGSAAVTSIDHYISMNIAGSVEPTFTVKTMFTDSLES